MNSVVKGLQGVGTVHSWVSIIGSSIIAIILFISAVYLGFIYHRKWKVAKATVNDVKCQRVTVNNKIQEKCLLNITYTNESGVSHTTQITHTGNFFKGQEIKISYNPNNLDDVRVYSHGLVYLAIGLFVVGVILVSGAIMTYVLRKNKTYQTIQGVSALI